MATRTENDFYPDYAVAPGETLRETLEELGLTQAELAERTGLSRKTINQIVNGNAALTPDVALRLELATGVPARLWNSLEAAYRDALARLALHRRLEPHKSWLKGFPVQEMMERRWLPLRYSPMDQLVEVLRFFGVSSPDEWSSRWATAQASYRLSPSHPADPGALSAWLCQGEKSARQAECQPYDEARFRDALRALRGLTAEPPAVSQARMQALCAQAGVAVVVVPELSGTRAHGATRWLTPDKALLQLSLRYRWEDILWFSFFHEAGHILLHGKSRAFVDSESETCSPEEDEADQFAQDYLIAPKDYQALCERLSYSEEAVRAFAAAVGVAPGIVVGRLQHDGRLPHARLNGLRVRLAGAEASA